MGLPSLALVAGGLLLAAFVLAVVAGLDLTVVQFSTPVLRDRADLARFRGAIHRQRWLALGVILLFVAAGAVLLVGLLGGWCRADDLPLTAGAGVPLLVVEVWVRHAERRFKAVPAADPRLQAKWLQLLLWWE